MAIPPNIERIVFKSGRHFEMIPVLFPLLVSVDVSGLKDSMELVMSVLYKNCKGLEWINVSDRGLNCFSRLKHIYMSGNHFNGNVIDNVLRLKEIRHLEVERPCNVSSQSIAQLAVSNPDLQFLSVQGTDLSFEAIETLASHCPNLQQLHIGGMKGGSSAQCSATFSVMLKNCRLLTHITIDLNKTPSANGIAASIAHHCPQLQSLVASGFNSSGLRKIAARCHCITHLDLSSNAGTDNAALLI